MKTGEIEKIISEENPPKGIIYTIIISYVTTLLLIITVLTFKIGNLEGLNPYVFINLFTVITLAWIIRRSFRFSSRGRGISLLRAGLFLMVNSSLISLAGGIKIIPLYVASFAAAIIYAPALVILIFSFNNFLCYAEKKYNHAINLSLTDELTGLPNRRHMNIKLEELEGKCGVICIADIDFFKKINDSYGHEMGDTVLRGLGDHLKKFISDDIFIARSGGEEFTIIFFKKMEVKDDLRRINDSFNVFKNSEISVTLSLGVAEKHKDASVASALSAADKALYDAKKAGRNCIVFSSKRS